MPIGLRHQELDLSWAAAGVLPSPIWLMGYDRVLAAGLTASDATVRDCSGHHLRLVVNSLTGSGIIEITGTGLAAGNSTPLLGHSEQLVVDGVGAYRTEIAWWTTTNVAIQGAIGSINYDLQARSLLEYPQRSVQPIRYRMEIVPKSGTNRNVGLYLVMTQVDQATKKATDTVLEDVLLIRTGAGAEIVDQLRTGAADRSATVPVLENVGGVYVLEMPDLADYVPPHVEPEGLFGKVDWQNIDYFHILLEMITGPFIP